MERVYLKTVGWTTKKEGREEEGRGKKKSWQREREGAQLFVFQILPWPSVRFFSSNVIYFLIDFWGSWQSKRDQKAVVCWVGGQNNPLKEREESSCEGAIAAGCFEGEWDLFLGRKREQVSHRREQVANREETNQRLHFFFFASADFLALYWPLVPFSPTPRSHFSKNIRENSVVWVKMTQNYKRNGFSLPFWVVACLSRTLDATLWSHWATGLGQCTSVLWLILVLQQQTKLLEQ